MHLAEQITGTFTRLQLLILGRYDGHGVLRAVGRMVPLRPDAAQQVGGLLAAAGPSHPWTGVTFASAWGSRDVLDVCLVRPELVAEISARSTTAASSATPSTWVLSGRSWAVGGCRP
ncbi:hypothetical protein ACIQUQ_33230 [Streptomyces sp. NPDC101118]|uniref:hypothetical protein n=1 Tax=Streptomyces sp. NPDC101118 TaxID=3366109 RepID=UPI0038081FDD